MEESRRRAGEEARKWLMTADDSVRNWHLRGKNFKENIIRQVGDRKEQDRRDLMREMKKHERQRGEERSRRIKSPKTNFPDLDLKPLMKARTCREEVDSREERRFRKNTDRARRKDFAGQREASPPFGDAMGFHRAWEHSNFSLVPSRGAKDSAGRERKRKRTERLKIRNKSAHRLEVGSTKNAALAKLEKNKKMRVIPSLDDFVSGRSNYMGEAGGKAVVIYHRHNRKYLYPHTGDGYRFEQIAFTRNSEAAFDLLQSRRSLSEPRKNNTKEWCVARRRTRFQVEPNKMASTPSEFHSAIDFLKQSSGSVEFKKFEGLNSSFSSMFSRNPWHEKYLFEKKQMNNRLNSNQYHVVLGKSKSTTNFNSGVGVRLQKTAEKKLDLHREMIRTERNNKKKFWESIERSLNYRCALAEMFSSQSFLSSNESSRFFSSTDNSTSRSTNIYFRESVISSYQGFSRFITSNKPDFSNKTKPLMIPQAANTKYRTMKTLLNGILIKEDEEGEEEIVLREQVADGFTSQSSSDSTVQTDTSAEHVANDYWSLMENTLELSDTSSQLELLMSRLSEEIRKCSDFLENVESEKKKSVASSVSESKIESKKENVEGIPANWKTSNKAVFVYSATEIKDEYEALKNLQAKVNKSMEKLKQLKNDQSFTEITKTTDGSLITVTKEGGALYGRGQQTRSNLSMKSYEYNKIPNSSNDAQSKISTMEFRDKLDKFMCCEDCQRLMDRIIKLENDLEKLEKKMPLYPTEYQETIRDCLESLNATSETLLRRLKSCAKLRSMDQNKKYKKGQQETPRRPSSAPGPVVHEFYKKKVDIRPSNSDCQLNVGMQLTMENVDPVTGVKLGPAKKGPSQEGNVKCRVFQEGKKPLLVLDTDFTYNPETGMLFKKKSGNDAESFTLDLSSSSKSKKLLKTPSRVCNCLRLEHEPIKLEPTRPKTPKKESPPPEVTVCTAMEEPEMKPVKKSGVGKPKSKGSGKSSEEPVEKRPETKKKPKAVFFEKKNEKPCSFIPVRKKATPNSSGYTKSASTSRTSSTFTLVPLEFRTFPLLNKLAKLFSFTWTFGFFLCKLVHYMQSVSAICSVLTLTAMSLERYYAIVHPMKAQYICTISQARRIITATWVSAFLLAVPILFAQVHLRVGVKVEAYWCVRDWDNKLIWRAHELYMMLLILVVPTGVMAVAYTAICWEIWEVIQRRQDMTSGKGHRICRKARLARNSSNDSFPSSFCTNSTRADKGRGRGFLKKELADDGASVKQVIKMLVAVVVIYVICWGPMLIDNVLQAYGILSHIRMGWLKYMGTTFHLMAYFNSCINPIIYGFMSKNFRESFRKTLCCWGKKPKTANRSFSLSQTRNTSIRYAESSFGRNISIALPV